MISMVDFISHRAGFGNRGLVLSSQELHERAQLQLMYPPNIPRTHRRVSLYTRNGDVQHTLPVDFTVMQILTTFKNCIGYYHAHDDQLATSSAFPKPVSLSNIFFCINDAYSTFQYLGPLSHVASIRDVVKGILTVPIAIEGIILSYVGDPELLSCMEADDDEFAQSQLLLRAPMGRTNIRLWDTPMLCTSRIRLCAHQFVRNIAGHYLTLRDTVIVCEGIFNAKLACPLLWEVNKLRVRSCRLFVRLSVGNVHVNFRYPMTVGQLIDSQVSLGELLMNTLVCATYSSPSWMTEVSGAVQNVNIHSDIDPLHAVSRSPSGSTSLDLAHLNNIPRGVIRSSSLTLRLNTITLQQNLFTTTSPRALATVEQHFLSCAASLILNGTMTMTALGGCGQVTLAYGGNLIVNILHLSQANILVVKRTAMRHGHQMGGAEFAPISTPPCIRLQPITCPTLRRFFDMPYEDVICDTVQLTAQWSSRRVHGAPVFERQQPGDPFDTAQPALYDDVSLPTHMHAFGLRDLSVVLSPIFEQGDTVELVFTHRSVFMIDGEPVAPAPYPWGSHYLASSPVDVSLGVLMELLGKHFLACFDAYLVDLSRWHRAHSRRKPVLYVPSLHGTVTSPTNGWFHSVPELKTTPGATRPLLPEELYNTLLRRPNKRHRCE
jgi:hypothetical protein